MAVYHPLARRRHPASDGPAGLSALANGAPACPPWWSIARAAWTGEPAANWPPRRAVAKLAGSRTETGALGGAYAHGVGGWMSGRARPEWRKAGA